MGIYIDFVIFSILPCIGFYKRKFWIWLMPVAVTAYFIILFFSDIDFVKGFDFGRNFLLEIQKSQYGDVLVLLANSFIPFSLLSSGVTEIVRLVNKKKLNKQGGEVNS